MSSFTFAIASISLFAAVKHNEHSTHRMHDTQNMTHQAIQPSAETKLSEGGQAQFAALIEIVSLLEKDKNTDWDSVDIDALRSHLLDMSRLIQDTKATTKIISDRQINYTVTGNAESIPSIHRMAVAHAHYIEQSRGWAINSEVNNKDAVVQITVENPETLTRLEALGFYGFMSLDSHHQAHHYQIALGRSH